MNIVQSLFRFLCARLPEFPEFTQEQFRMSKSVWNPTHPNRVDLRFPPGWVTLDTIFSYPRPVWEINRGELLKYRKSPESRTLRGPDPSYAILETDDGKWFATGNRHDTHLDILEKFRIPPERSLKGLYSEDGVVSDEGEQSWAHMIGILAREGLEKCHVKAILWALDNGKDPYEGWNQEYDWSKIGLKNRRFGK